jgi:hypothetical protein
MYIWILTAIGMGLWLIYWHFARPVILLASRMELFRIRHEMRVLSEEECPSRDKRKLEAFCNGALRSLSFIDISDLMVKGRKRDEIQAEQDIHDILNSTEKSKNIFERMIKTMLATAVASSALLLIPALVIMGLAVWSSFFRTLIVFAKRRLWFLTVYSGDIRPPQMASCS